MRASARPFARFFALSTLLHLAILAVLGVVIAPDQGADMHVPDSVELGILDAAPGGEKSAPAPAPPAPPPARVAPVPRPAARHPSARVDVALAAPDASAAEPVVTPDAGARDGGAASAPVASGVASGVASIVAGLGLGFGSGGLGVGGPGAPGAMIALQADLKRIRDSSLLLETEALLDLIPGWQAVLEGSGLDPLRDFGRVWVATPTLRRAHLAISAYVRGGDSAVRQAASRLARRRRGQGVWTTRDGVATSPWVAADGAERVVALLGHEQMAIARASDISRVRSVAAALAARDAGRVGREGATGAAALLAMADGEAVTLSVEGLHAFVVGDARALPRSLRLSVAPLDEFHTELRAIGLYGDARSAEGSLAFVDALRRLWLEHPRVRYLGLQSALEEAVLAREAATISLTVKLTLHQTRYLLAFVRHTLKARD